MSNGVLRVWHFVVSQVVLFVTLLTFLGGFGSWAFSQLQDSFYPNIKGVQLEQMIERLNTNIEKQNGILTDLRLYIARNLKASEKMTD